MNRYAVPAPRAADDQAHSSSLPIPLHLLDSPANRELLRCLLWARDAVRSVDEERGHDGHGFAAVIEHFAAGVATEVHGPADLREEKRR